jgi:hypothetical protein
VISKHLPNRGDQEWVEFEEVPGPDPNPSQRPDRGLPIHLDIMLVKAYPWREEAPRRCGAGLEMVGKASHRHVLARGTQRIGILHTAPKRWPRYS